jgi:hypothetical protein
LEGGALGKIDRISVDVLFIEMLTSGALGKRERIDQAELYRYNSCINMFCDSLSDIYLAKD